MTSYMELTELWYANEYQLVADTINNEAWDTYRVANFMLYFVKYVGLNESKILCKLL